MKIYKIKYSCLFLLLLTSTELILAQQDSLVDVFPLAINNRWIYSFDTHWQAQAYHYWERDTGSAEYQIINFIPSADSTRWQFVRRRNFTRYGYSGVNPNIPPVTMQDSNYFEIVEMNTGHHELYAPNFDITDAFSFWRNYADSTRFFRYLPTDTSDNYLFIRNAYLLLNYKINSVLCKDLGIIQSSGTGSYGEHYGWSYTLLSPLFTNPHLKLSKSVFITALKEIPYDTTIMISNDGKGPLNIYGITSTDTGLIASVSTPVIPSTENAFLSLQCRSPKEGITSLKIIISSSSISSPDTIDISIQGEIAAQLNTIKDINFGEVFYSRRYLDTTLAIFNTGNKELTIDSITISCPNYAYKPITTIAINHIKMNHEDTVWCKARLDLSPTRNVIFESYLTIYSNAKSSPDIIRLFGTIKGGWIMFDVHSLSFDTVDVGKIEKLEFGIQAIGGDMYLQRINFSNPAFSALNTIPSPLPRDAIAGEIIQFAPQKSGIFNGYITYTSRSIYQEDIYSAIDTVWFLGYGRSMLPTNYFLYQNYPNPFNPNTTIIFDVPIDVFVSLKLYDLLGREVATIANENLKAGSYERIIDGSRLASGIYFYKLQAGSFSSIRKMALIK